jgi:clan AA aspartic protease
MGQVYANIELINSIDLNDARRNIIDQDEVRRIQINALVATGACLMCINENIQSILNLPFVKRERYQLAGGERAEYDVVGPVEIRFADQKAICNAVVLPEDREPLLGAIPMEDMDVSVHPNRQELVVNTRLPITGFWASRRGKLIYT